MMKMAQLLLLAGAACLPMTSSAALAPVGPTPVTIVSQADTWNYNVGASLGSGLPTDGSFSDFTSGYTGNAFGQAAFGNSAPFGAPVHTNWSAYSALYLQKTVSLSTALVGDVILNLAVDNGAAVWINGVNVFNADAGGFTSIWEYSRTFASDPFVVGDNVISVIANDYGGATYFDMELVGTSAVPVPAAAWLFVSALGVLRLAVKRRAA